MLNDERQEPVETSQTRTVWKRQINRSKRQWDACPTGFLPRAPLLSDSGARKREQEITHPQSTSIIPLPMPPSPFVRVRNRTGHEAGTETRGPWERGFSLSSNGVWKRPNNYCQLNFSKWKTDKQTYLPQSLSGFISNLLHLATTTLITTNYTYPIARSSECPFALVVQINAKNTAIVSHQREERFALTNVPDFTLEEMMNEIRSSAWTCLFQLKSANTEKRLTKRWHLVYHWRCAFVLKNCAQMPRCKRWARKCRDVKVIREKGYVFMKTCEFASVFSS